MYQPAPNYPPQTPPGYGGPQDPQGYGTPAPQPGYYQQPAAPYNGQPGYTGYQDPHQPPNPAAQNYNTAPPMMAPIQPVTPSNNDVYFTDSLSRKLSDSSRIGFIRKVFSIVATQLSFTALCVAFAFIDQRSTQKFYGTPAALGLLIVSLFTYMICLYAIGCYRNVARSVPTNYILLSLFTVAFSYITAGISAWYEPDIVLAAATITAAMTIGLTVYAMYTKTDFTYCGGFMFAFMFVIFAGMILTFFMPRSIGRIALSCLVILLLCFYIIYDIQVIVGKQELALEIDDYVFASMMLYLDIMRLFLELLKILGRK